MNVAESSPALVSRKRILRLRHANRHGTSGAEDAPQVGSGLPPCCATSAHVTLGPLTDAVAGSVVLGIEQVKGYQHHQRSPTARTRAHQTRQPSPGPVFRNDP